MGPATLVDDAAGLLCPTLTTMSPNCSGSVSLPSVSIGIWTDRPRGPGGCASSPAAGSTFWLRIAFATSMAVMSHAASFCGSSQARML